MTTFTNISKRSPTSQNCHSHKSSPTTIWRFLFPLLLIRTWLSYIGPNVRCTSMLKVCLSNNKMKKKILKPFIPLYLKISKLTVVCSKSIASDITCCLTCFQKVYIIRSHFIDQLGPLHFDSFDYPLAYHLIQIELTNVTLD